MHDLQSVAVTDGLAASVVVMVLVVIWPFVETLAPDELEEDTRVDEEYTA